MQSYKDNIKRMMTLTVITLSGAYCIYFTTFFYICVIVYLMSTLTLRRNDCLTPIHQYWVRSEYLLFNIFNILNKIKFDWIHWIRYSEPPTHYIQEPMELLWQNFTSNQKLHKDWHIPTIYQAQSCWSTN